MQCATTPNPVNYATFNSSGFVSDGLASGSIPSGYPTASDVNTVFTSLSSDTSLSYTTVNTMTQRFIVHQLLILEIITEAKVKSWF